MEFGPDGALYVLDYGTGYFNGDENSAVYRIENATNGHSPIAEAKSDRTSGQAPLEVAFSSEGSSDADGDELSYSWDFGDGATSTRPTRRTPTPRTAPTPRPSPPATRSGRTGSASVIVTVGNTAPEVELKVPADGTPFAFGDEVPFKVEVTDPEDGEIDCSKVEVSYILGHDSHGHPITSAKGCKGTIKTSEDGEHDPNANIFGVFDAKYTDKGGGGQAPLTAHEQSILQPEHRQAEHFAASAGDGVEATGVEGAEGGHAVGDTRTASGSPSSRMSPPASPSSPSGSPAAERRRRRRGTRRAPRRHPARQGRGARR